MAAYPTFPQLSRRPSLKTRRKYASDPTIWDTLDNGMESTRARFTRRRREWTVTLDFLTAADVLLFDQFVELTAVYGANPFYFPDHRDPHNPALYLVRFSKLPEDTDAGWIGTGFRQNRTFDLREV